MKWHIHKSISIQALPSKVWNALTDTELIRKYLVADVEVNQYKKKNDTAFSPGGEGPEYIDAGKIMHIIPEKLLHIRYLNEPDMGGIAPANFYDVTYELETVQDDTTIRITQDNIENEEKMNQIGQNWEQFLLAIKKLTETREP